MTPHSRSRRRRAPSRRAYWLLLCCCWIFPPWLLAEDAAVPGRYHSAPPTSAAKTIHLGYGAAEGDLGLALAQKIYPAAFGRAGKRVRISPMPGERSLIEANAGRLDGDGARFGSARIENHYPNLLRVQEPLLVSNTSAFSTESFPGIRNWSDLARLSLRMVFVRGYKLVESRLSAMGLLQGAFRAGDHCGALRFLVARRADVLISTELTVRAFLCRKEFRNAGIRRIGVLERDVSYLYLHKRHATLAEQMAEVLREMKADGTYRSLFQDIIQNLTPENTEGYWLPE